MAYVTREIAAGFFQLPQSGDIPHDDDLAIFAIWKGVVFIGPFGIQGAGRDDDLIVFDRHHHGSERGVAQEVIQWLGDIRVV